MAAVHRWLAAGLAAAVSLTGALPGQDHGGRAGRQGALPFSPADVARRSYGVGEVDGQVWGGGHGFRAHFADQGVKFVPTMRWGARRTLPLRVQLESVRRGANAPQPVPAATRRHDGHRVDYLRGDLRESYEIRPDGIEQTFTFDSLPAGQGDLVVRLGVDTELVPTAVDRDVRRLAFREPGCGGVEIGAVTGIDAAGHRAEGTMRYAAGGLELVLPAELVDHAALPLMVDPLIGSIVTVAGTGDLDPAVAYDASNDVYLVVWEEVISAPSHVHISGQRVNPNGGLVGGKIFVEIIVSAALDPTVASINARNAFAVAWEDTGNLRVRQVDAATGSVSGLAFNNTASYDQHPALGGEAVLGGGDDAVLVWHDSTNNAIRAANVTVPAGGATPVLSNFKTLASSNDSWPSITPSGGPSGRYLVVWQRGSLTGTTVHGMVVNRSLATVVSPFAITTAGRNDALTPTADGDGNRWLVAYESRSSALIGDIACRAVRYFNPTTPISVGAEVAVTSTPNADDSAPVVAFLSSSFLIGYSSAPGPSFTNRDAYVASVDPFSCASCEGVFVLEATVAASSESVAVASEYSGNPVAGADRAMLAWQAATTTSTRLPSSVRIRPFIAGDGGETDLGGGCGRGGRAVGRCAVVGNQSFTHRLMGAATGVPAALVLGLGQLNFTCGSCVLVPDPSTGVTLPAGVTSALGEAMVPMPLPPDNSLVGVRFIDQWILLPGVGAACSAFGVDLSRATEILIE